MVRMLLTASWLEMWMRPRALTRDWHGAAALTFADSAVSHFGLMRRAAEIAGGNRDNSGLLERNLGQRREKVGDPGDAAQSGRPAAGPPFAVRAAARPIISLVRCRRGARSARVCPRGARSVAAPIRDIVFRDRALTITSY